MKRYLIRTLLATLLLGAIFVIPKSIRAQAACTKSISSVPYTLNQAGAVYCLTNDITSGSGDLTITASDVTLDGQNHSITASSSITVTAGTKNNLVIRNLQLLNGRIVFGDAQHDVTCNGNTCTPDYWVSDMLIENNTFRKTGYNYSPYLQFSVVRRMIFRNNTVELLSSTGNTLQLHFTMDSLFENNTIKQTVVSSTYTDETWGLVVRDSSSRNTFRNNTIVTNGHNTMIEAVGYAKNLVVDGTTFGCPSLNTFDSNTLISLPNSIGQGREGVVSIQCTGGGIQMKNNILYSVQNPALNIGQGGSDASGLYNHNTFVTTGTKAIPIDGARSYKFTNNIIYGTIDTGGTTVAGSSYNLYFPANATLQGRETNTLGVSPQFVGPLPTWSGLTNADDIVSIAATVKAAVQLLGSSPANSSASDGTDRGADQSGGGSCVESWSCGAWSTCANSTQSRTCTDANSCGTTVARPPLTQSCTVTPPPDTTAPTVSITAPVTTTTVNGTVTVAASASDNIGVVGVTFYASGIMIGTEDTTAPYSVSWNTTTYQNGTSKVLTAVARDAAGNTTTSSAVTVTVQQPVICTENWNCGSWSICTNGTQTRTCTDTNHCGTTTSKPPVSQSCIVPDVAAPNAVFDLQAL